MKGRTLKKASFTEEQIIGLLLEQEAGVTRAKVSRRHDFGLAMFIKWKARYGGLEVSDAKRLKDLADENGKLRRTLADAMLDNAALKGLKKTVTPAPLLQALGDQPKAAVISINPFEIIVELAAEDEKLAAERIDADHLLGFD